MTKLTPETLEAIIRDVAELPDRTSPDDAPEMMLVTANELRVILIGQLGQQAAAPGVEQMREALEKIRDHWACQYDHPRKEWEMYQGPYGIGITDGHRAAASIARNALAVAPPPQPDLEDVAQWMIARSYATGHGDTIADLLAELVEQVRERAVAPPPSQQAWRPIENAPRESEEKILLAKIVGHPDHPTAVWWACRGYWSKRWNNWNDGVEPSGLAGPTHWLPISGHGVG